ncbi:hypothetical protein DFH06DRAFT_1331207 [Mycena polygramma]|nr:hypothetical protein DFH06DRAFT_1331207 [Mycena polygramma]
MPGKHVHFSEDVVFPPTPSPSYSVSSLPSSYGPYTPPQNNAYLPGAAFTTHPVLGWAGPTPYLSFDVTLPHGNVQPTKNIPPSVLHEQATSPPLSSLVLVHPSLPWQIAVHATRGRAVTVSDVLSGIYTSLRQQASAAEYGSLTPVRQKEVTAAYTRRWTRMPNPSGQAVEKAKGLKRVDFLGPTVAFAGISQSQMGPNCWNLLLA